jgi:glycerol-3-phosphate dehydrogenase
MNLNENALMLPLKVDNKVLFVIPWMGKQIIGTTDSKVNKIEDDPEALEEEINFLLHNFNKICKDKINKKDIQSIYTGLRPLVNINKNNTSFVSREHTILINKSKMITIVGGKWTTYRKMAEEVTNLIFKMNKNYNREICKTKNLSLNTNAIKKNLILNLLKKDNSLSEKIHEKYTFRKVDVLYSIKYEMATNIIDVLARRNRLLFLDVKSSIESAPIVANIFAKYLNKDSTWIKNEITNFENYSKKYLPK